MEHNFKALGNAAFSAGAFSEAIAHFTSAIALDPTNHVLYSNRSAAHASLGDFASALKDAEETVRLAPQWAKSYSRLATAHHGLQQFDDAEEAINKGLEIDPNNAALLKARADMRATLNAGSEKVVDLFSRVLEDPKIFEKIAAHPSLRQNLSDSSFMSALQQVIANPTAATSLLTSHPALLTTVLTLMGLDMSAPSEPSGPAKPAEPDVHGHQQPTISPEQERINAIKESGNAAYKARDFDTALEKYSEALGMTETPDPRIMLNISAVYFEQKEYAKVVPYCDQIVELARQQRMDFAFLAKVLTRKARALELMDDLQGALAAYRAALADHRTADTLARLNAVEKKIAEQVKQDYFNPELCDQARDKGNELFSKGLYADAIKEYTDAIRRNEADPRAYANRSACYHKLGAVTDAQKDAETAIELSPDYLKGYVRKINALVMKREYSDALVVCDAAMAINNVESVKRLIEQRLLPADTDPTVFVEKQRREIQELSLRCYNAVEENQRKIRNASHDPKERQKIIDEALKNPEIAKILSDPAMNSILKSMQDDPRAAQAHMADPVIAAKVRKLIDAGIVSTQ